MTTTKACIVDGCERPIQARDLCNTHYSRWRKTGSTANPKRPTLADRLWSRVVGMPSGCWEYTGYRNAARGGYGRIHDHASNQGIGAHRAAWIVAYGPIPAGMLVRHRCDNPPCCNPEHLELGVNADNSADKVSRGRQSSGEANGASKLSADDVRDIRSRAALGEVQRRIAEDYNVTPSLVCVVVKRRIWKEVTP